MSKNVVFTIMNKLFVCLTQESVKKRILKIDQDIKT